MRLRTSLTWGCALGIGLLVWLAVFLVFLGLGALAGVDAPGWSVWVGTTVPAVAASAVSLRAFTVLLTPRQVRLVGFRGVDAGEGYLYSARIGTHRTGSGGEHSDTVGVIISADGARRGPLSRPFTAWESAAPARLVDAHSPRAERSRSRLREIVAVVEAAHGPIRIERFDLADRRAILTMLGRSD